MEAYFFLQDVAQEGFDWDSPFAAAGKVKEELNEVLEELHKPPTSVRQQALEEEIGDLFLACSCLARHCKVDPEEAIILGLKKFEQRYSHFKFYIKEKGLDLHEASSVDLRILWQQCKQETAFKN